MKKQFVCAAIAGFLSTAVFAQSMVKKTDRTTFGIRAGVNFQNINGDDAAGNKLKNNLTTGFHAGVNAEVPVGSGFYVQPGALYSTKGTEYEGGAKAKLSYIEV